MASRVMFLPVASAALLAAYVAPAAPPPWLNDGMISDFAVGIFCRPPSPDSLSDDPDTIKGKVERYTETPVLVHETQTIPAIDGLTFGIKARKVYPFPGVVTITVTHPPLGKARVTEESWQTEMSTEQANMSAYYFGLSDGNPAGLWSFEGRRGSTLLFRAEFDVVTPGKSTVDPCKERQVS